MERGLDYVVGNMAWNATLIAALGMMVKKWMGSIETKIDRHCRENREDHKDIYGKIDDHEHRITEVETGLKVTK